MAQVKQNKNVHNTPVAPTNMTTLEKRELGKRQDNKNDRKKKNKNMRRKHTKKINK